MSPASRFTRRSILRVAGMATVGVALAGCGATPAPAQPAGETPKAAGAPSGKITYWHLWSGRYAEIQQKLVDAFMAEQADIKVEVLPVPSNIREKILTSVAAGQPPDAATNGDCQTMATAGALTDLTPFVEKRATDVAAIYPILMEGTKWNGKQWGFPANAGVEAWYYNKDKLAEVGIDTGAGPMDWAGPETWAEFLEVNKKLTKLDDSGNIVQTGAIPWALRGLDVWFWTNGGQAFDAQSGTVTINTPENVEALQYLVDYNSELYGNVEKASEFLSAVGSDADGPFCTAQQAITYDGNWSVSTYHDWCPSVRFGFFLFPKGPKGDKRYAYGASDWIYMPRGAKNPEQAYTFIEWYVMKGATLWNKSGVDLTPIMKDKDLIPDGHAAIFGSEDVAKQVNNWWLSCLSNSKGTFNFPAYGFMHQELFRVRDLALAGDMTALQALEEAQASVERQLEKTKLPTS